MLSPTYLKASKHYRFVCPTADHLEIESGTDELDRCDRGAVIVQGLQKQIILWDIKDMNEAIATGAGQKFALNLIIGVLQAQDLRFMRLDGYEKLEIL